MADDDQENNTVYETSGESNSSNISNFDSMRQLGMLLGEFRLLRRLGKGGMAEVWLAEQLSLKRNVALKLLRSDMMEDATYVGRFQTEAKAAAGLNHPNIVQVYTVGCEKGQHYIAQEYVQGQTLKDLIKKRGPLDVNLALYLMRQVSSALQTAAERGIVHRDIKPENIMITKKGEAKVADFGLAQLQGGERLNLTQEGMTMGTPLYMSPEQVSGKKIDHRSDIYSLGVTFYHMLAGRPPFQGENAVSIAVQHLHNPPEPLATLRPDLPTAVCKLVERMIAKNPADRYQTAQDIFDDVKRLAKGLKSGELLDDLAVIQSPVKSFPVRRPKIVLPLLCLLIGLMSAGIGWGMRPSVPSSQQAVLDPTIPKFDSAKGQFLQAMFLVDNEDAFLKVIQEFDDPKDKIWTQRAYEQLALLYLKDRQRAKDAEAALKRLEVFRDAPNYHAEARIGQAFLILRDDQTSGVSRAKTILKSSNDEFEHLSGSWKQLEDDVRRLVTSPDRN